MLTSLLVNNSCIISDQQTEMFFAMSDEPPSIIQWLYKYLNGQQVSELLPPPCHATESVKNECILGGGG